ncbi:TonB-dependent receptor [Sphingomonas oleivorans]|uniref:TonB-dependent receptor n=1 Tax=Sphingomonas oleivorans TaxID=1735121 RepID=A0A2T5FXV3_9SPHN|nr:TonB-dependent receptor [Sphingomonas oleivorans]PTQ10967.1 TonB-dependent receptor [Sphingomonas oleivorans]
MRSLLLCASILSAPALAQEAETVPEIVVTGRGLEPGAGEIAYDVVTIDRERLTSSASGRLEDVLRDAAGLQQFRRSDARSAHPTSQGASLRGLGGNASSRALLVLDGVPQIDPFGGWVNWAAFDPQRLEHVRVTRGGGSGVLGPGALAGTIELTSAGRADLAPAWGAIAYGSRDAIDADAGLSARLGGGFASLSASYGRGDGFVPIIKGQRGPVDRPARYAQGSVAARAVFPVGPDTELQASGLALIDERTRGLAFTDNRTSGADASLRLVGRGRWGWEALAYLQMREFSSGFASANATRTAVNQTLDQYNVPATGIGGRFELRPPIGDGVELRIGGDGRLTEGKTKELFTFVAGRPTRIRDAGGRTRTLGGFADLTVSASDALTLTGGARIDRWWIDEGHLREHVLATGASLTDVEHPDRSGWEPTARAGIAYRLGGGASLRGAAYLGWRLPTLNELYRPFRVGTDATAANPALKPERLRGIDAGIDFRPLPTVRLGATVFHNMLDDAIGNISLGRGPGVFPGVGFVAAGGTYRQRGNFDAVRSNGVELEAGLGDGVWRLDAAYAYVDARVRASGAAAGLDGMRPAQTPRHQASATLGWSPPGGIRAAATLRYVAAQFEDDQNVRRLDDAVTLDATASLPVMTGLMLEARAENVTDARVEAAISGDGLIERATPRSLWLGLRYTGW